jgi:hypothetical protein
MGKHDTLRQHVGNDKKPFRQHVPQLNRSSRLNLILGLTGERKYRGFLFKTRELATDPGLQSFQKADFIFRRKADQHRDAIAKKNRNAGFANPDRERDRRKSFAFETDRIDPISHMQRVRGNLCSHFGGNQFGSGHDTISSRYTLAGFEDLHASL